MQGYHDLVAGDGIGGLQDGPFYSSHFNFPKGLALSADGKTLYVSDQNNHCVRAIDLEKGNQVSTLAGTGKPGFADGALNAAAFNKPGPLVYLPNQQIAVCDDENNRIRLINITQKTVSTLAGDGTAGIRDGERGKAQVGSIWNMAYLPSQDTLYFTQPDFGALRKIDLKTRKVSTVYIGSTGQPLPHPGALCVVGDKLYVADRQEAQVYELTPKPNSTADGKEDFGWNLVSAEPKILALTWSDGFLYGVINNPTNPVACLWPNPHPVGFISPWSSDSTQNTQKQTFFFEVGYPMNFAFIADPQSGRKFYMAHPFLNIITSFRDLWFDQLKDNETYNTGGLMDFEYPHRKPPKTYRILILSDSHLFHDYRIGGDIQNRTELTAKRLEFMLNTEAALDNVPLHFEILVLARVSSDSLNLWPYYAVPPVVKQYDIDQVLMEMPARFDLYNYYDHPLTKESIPSEKMDSEFMTQSWPQKSNTTISEKFLDLCVKNNLATFYGNGRPYFSDPAKLIQNPEIRLDMVQMFSRPLKLLNQALGRMKTSADGPVRMTVCLMPYAQLDGNIFNDQLFWQNVLDEMGAPAINLFPVLTTLRISYFPFAESGGQGHFDANGHLLISYLLAHDLIQDKLIPWK